MFPWGLCFSCYYYYCGGERHIALSLPIRLGTPSRLPDYWAGARQQCQPAPSSLSLGTPALHRTTGPLRPCDQGQWLGKPFLWISDFCITRILPRVSLGLVRLRDPTAGRAGEYLCIEPQALPFCVDLCNDATSLDPSGLSWEVNAGLRLISSVAQQVVDPIGASGLLPVKRGTSHTFTGLSWGLVMFANCLPQYLVEILIQF